MGVTFQNKQKRLRQACSAVSGPWGHQSISKCKQMHVVSILYPIGIRGDSCIALLLHCLNQWVWWSTDQYNLCLFACLLVCLFVCLPISAICTFALILKLAQLLSMKDCMRFLLYDRRHLKSQIWLQQRKIKRPTYLHKHISRNYWMCSICSSCHWTIAYSSIALLIAVCCQHVTVQYSQYVQIAR